ncbi:MAG: TolC family protein [Chitinophagaceae bacterium]|nr:TolC family protein [Chitinophagaceae bacterium]
MKKLLLILLLFADAAFAQTFTLEQVQDLAKQNYPLIKQKELIQQTKEISIANLQKGFLPQFALNGQATYQSEVTQVKIPVPGVSIQPLSKDQYRALGDVNQTLYDGGLIKQQKNIQQLNAGVEEQKLEVQLYALRERINSIYLGILFIDDQLQQTELVKTDIQTGMKKVEAQIANGVAFKSYLNTLKAELLKAEQRSIELSSTRSALVETLELFINQSISADAVFQRPVVKAFTADKTIARPELNLFKAQQKLFDGQHGLISARNQPKAGLFFQGGYGRPGLNLLENKFAFFYTTGVRFSWNFGGLYTAKKEKELIEINKKNITLQQEAFLLNTNTQLKQQQGEVNKIQLLIQKDDEIIDLRKKVKEASNAQLENGVITANDYLREVNAEDQARQTRILHLTQLLQAQINYLNIQGKTPNP